MTTKPNLPGLVNFTPNQERLRRRLPGHRTDTLLAADKKRELWHIFEVRGFLDELLTVSCYWLKHKDGRTDVFSDINDALKAW